MNETDRVHFATQIQWFATVHEKSLTKKFVDAYWDELSGMDRFAFDIACRRLRGAAKWMPKPSDFRRAYQESFT